MLRKTKIIATIGPSSNTEEKLSKLAKAGVNVFRINFSHSTSEQIKDYINKIHKVRNKLNLPISIMVDTKGPEIRVKTFKTGKVNLKKGSNFVLTSSNVLGDETIVSVTQKICIDNAKINSVVLANDGQIKFVVKEKQQDKLILKVVSGGELSNNKSLSFVNQHFNLEYLNESDKQNLQIALKEGIEYISASFVSNKQDLNTLKDFVYNFDKDVKIISKIENSSGIKNLDSILENCDGVMVARGDLGVETKFEKLPIYQKQIIDASHKHSKICIVATEMLESMISSIRPTRAEISDVAKAVFDGAGVVMLSGETAVGNNPVSCVKIMSNIVKEAENAVNYQNKFNLLAKNPKSSNELIIQSAVNSSFYLNCKAIVSYTSKGRNALKLSTKFAKAPIVAITDNKKTYNLLSMISNVVPVLETKQQDIFTQASNVCKKYKIAKPNDLILVTTGTTDNISNVLKFEQIK